MDNKVADCLRSLASGFSYLADELEKQQEENDKRMNSLETEVLNNRQALKDAANAILNNLGWGVRYENI